MSKTKKQKSLSESFAQKNKTSTPKMNNSQFDLEQNILDAWGIVECMKLLYDRTDGIEEQELKTALSGIIWLGQRRFDKLTESFENFIFENRAKKLLSENQKALDSSINNTYHVISDLNTIYENSDDIHADPLMNSLLGVIQITEWNFQKLFKNFELCIADSYRDRNSKQD